MSHFYLPDATPFFFVPNKAKGGMRPATIKDAREAGAVPSVTTVLSDLNKEQLNQWRVGEGIKVALGMGVTEVTPEVMAEVVRKSEEYRDYTATFGSAVHDGISRGFKGSYQLVSPVLGVDEVVTAFLKWAEANALVVNEAELSFASSLGYGGTIDGLGTWYGEPALFDWKTQSFGSTEDSRKTPLLYDPEWPLQLAGYDIGVNAMQLPGFPDGGNLGLRYDTGQPLTRISFILSRTRPGLVVAHQWKDNERYDAAWLSLFDHWCAVHRWGKWAAKPSLQVLQGGLALEGEN